MREITSYIRVTLNNPAFAEHLLAEFEEAGNRIPAFPYANPVFFPVTPKQHQYRTLLVRNYLMFYWIDEDRERVSIVHVIDARGEYERRLT